MQLNTTPTLPPIVTSVSPTTATTGTNTVFTVNGSNLPAGLGFSLEDCTPANSELGGASASQRQFQCTLGAAVGSKAGMVKTSPSGGALFAFSVAASGAGATTITPPATATTSRLNDTGITASQCYQAGSDVLVSCSSSGALALNASQDGMTGRDAVAATNSSADGKLGFSYTKIDANGQTLSSTATAWSCVKDNVTGRIWEVKTNDGGLRDKDHSYTNYDSRAQALLSSSFNPVLVDINAATNSIGFKNAVNAVGLCGANDWRLPTADELHGLVDYGVASPGPMIDANLFPNTVGNA